MEGDDEFGDLYTDVLRPLTSSAPPPQNSAPQPQPSPSPPRRPIDLNLKVQDDEILPGAAPSHSPAPDSSYSTGHGVQPRVLVPPDTKLTKTPLQDLKLLASPKAEVSMETKSVDLMDTDVKFDIEEDDGPHIPGVSGMPMQSNGGDAAGDDWDSDSEDELQIVLNEKPQHGPVGVFGEEEEEEEDDDDEDGEPLVIVDGGPTHQMEESNWCEDSELVGPDGERKEAAGAEAEKTSAGGVAAVPKVGYNSHAYHPFHSQFKYVRPGATPLPGSSTTGSSGASGQVHPLVNVGPIAGRGRGEWRPAGIKGGPGLQKYAGYGAPAWGSGRSYGGGLEFTLPSHKTIFEVDIDSFEEKPWKYPGADITDFFNFGLNEESWKDYCKKLEQHRLETTMQSRIRVYESVRTEQEFDPDMPPELAAATGILDAAENANTAKSEAGQDAKVLGRVRPPLPTGRPIQVENGSGERLPSIDTRTPRIRDSDAIIEIICQDLFDDDSSTGHGVPDQHDIELPNEEAREDDMAERGNAHEVNENSDIEVGQKREHVGRRTPAVDSVQCHAAEGDEALPPHSKVPVQHPSASQGQTPRNNGSPNEGRACAGARGRSPYMSPAHSKEEGKFWDKRDDSIESMDRKRTSRESSLGHREVTPMASEGISEQEREDVELDEQTPTDTLEDDVLPRSRIKQQTSPQADQPVQEFDDVEDSRAGRSSENSKARSGSSREYQKWHDGVEEEVVQAGRPSRHGGTKRHLNQNEPDYRRKDHEMTQEIERNHMVAKGPDGSYKELDRDQSMVHNMHMRTEGSHRRKERDPYDRSWQRKDDDLKSRRDRIEDTRKRDRLDEMGFRHKSRVHESERGEKDEYLLLSSRKHIENGSYEANFDKDVSSRVRERDDSLRSGRRERAGEFHSKRRREDEYSRRDHADKEEILHPLRESMSRQKRERDDDRKQDEHPRGRDDIEDRHSLRPKGDASSNRERSEKRKNREGSHKSRSAHDEHVKPEREGQGNLKSGRSAEDRERVAHVKTRGDHKILDKDRHSKDSLRHAEQVKIREYSADESSHKRDRENTYSRGNQTSYEEKRSRQDRPTTRNDHGTRERGHKENMKKTKDSEGGDNHAAVFSKRNQDNPRDRVTETGGRNENNPEDTLHHQSSRKHSEDASSDDEQSDSRRGRSKLERWTSHKERDFTISSKSSSSLKLKEPGRKSNGGTPESNSLPVEPSKPVETSAKAQQAAVEDGGRTGDADALNNAENKLIDNRHLDTVEKLKKRSERFKLPMPSGKETAATKKVENEAVSVARIETPTDSETKHERPARKRRWTSN